MDDSSKKKKLIIIIISILALIIIGIGLFLFVFNKKDVKKEKIDKEQEEIIEDSTYEKLEKDLENGTLTKDQYILNLAYYFYDSSKLDEKYKSSVYLFRDDVLDNELSKYVNDISFDTAKYILEQYFLSDVTFNIDNKTNTNSNVNINPSFMDNTNENKYSTKNKTNLNKVLLSSSGNFLIWYTTEGDSKITDAQAKSIADSLDNTVKQYDSFFNTTYKFKSELDFEDNEKFKSQEKILESFGYDKNLLGKKLSVYIFHKKDDSSAAAVYNHQIISTKIINEITKKLNEEIFNGADYDIQYINVPYVIFYSNNFSNMSSSLATINHELFHHYQNQILPFKNSEKREGFDKKYPILEATANWASSKVSKNDGGKDVEGHLLNGWAAYAKTYHKNMFSDELFGSRGGYEYFTFLDSYEKNVSNGLNKIVDSIFEENAFDYLENNASKNEMKNTFQYMALRTLDQDYLNKNLLAITSNKMFSFEVDEIKIGDSKNNITLYKGGFDYYKFNKVDESAFFNIKLNSSYDSASLMLIAYKDGKYSVLNDYDLDIEYTTIDLSKYKNFYDTMYFTIVNSSFKKDVYVDFSIDSVAKQKEDKKAKEEPKQEEKEEEYVPNTETFQTGIKNYNIKITNVMSMAGMDSVSVSYGVTDELHQKQYLKTNTEVMGFTVTSEIYSDYKNNVSYTLEPFSSEWYKDTGVSNYMSMSLIVDKLNKDKNVTKLGDNKYKVKFSKDDLKTIVNKDTDTSAIKGDVYGIVYTSGKYITKMEYDFSNIIDLIDKYTMVIEFSNYDKAGDVNIPVSATK